MGTASLLRRKLLRSVSLNDFRGLTCVLVGACVYLLLFSAFGFPTTPSITAKPIERFPRKLWQSWKRAAVSFDERDAQRVRSWFKENPTLRYEVLTDDNALFYVQQTYGSGGFDRPDVVLAYQSLRADIVKADLLRYLVMYAEGGIYADVDVEALRPFEDFIPKAMDEKDLDLVIGIETDEPIFKDHPILGVKAQSFSQWTFICKPHASVMLKLINNIVTWLSRLKETQQREFGDLEFDFDTVLNGTGPSAFTTAVLEDMSASEGRSVEWNEFHRLREPRVVQRILVLPAECLASSTGHSESGTYESMGALVRHHYGASSWTKHHSRYKHPVYGEVERCNWNPECVELWDANTAEFDALSEADQVQILASQQAGSPGTRPLEDQNSGITESEAEADVAPASRENSNIDDEIQMDITSLSKSDKPDESDHAASESTLHQQTEHGIPDVATLEDMLLRDEAELHIPDIATFEDRLMQDS